MYRSLAALLLVACAAPDGPSAFEMPPPPPGSGTMTLTGPAAFVSGDAVTFEVTAAGLQPGDVVELGAGTVEGPGICPHRAQTGGSPCLEVAGRMAKLGREVAFDDGGVVKARFALDWTSVDPVAYVQAFFLAGASSATSNVLAVVVQQPWPELDPRVDALEAAIADLQATVDAQAATITDLQAALGDADSRADTIAADVAALQAGLGDAGSDIDALELALGGLSDVPGDLAAALADILALQAGLAAAQGDVDQLGLDLTQTDADLGVAEAGLAAVQAQVTAMGTSLTVTGPVRVGATIYNAWSGLVPVGGSSYSVDPLHLKTAWSCTGGVMWNVEFAGYNFLAARPIRTSSVGYAYATAGGITANQDRDDVDGTTVATTYCSSDGKVSFKLTSNAAGTNKWHASNVVLNLVGGPSSYASAAANSFQILAAEMRAANF
ncbi:MAG TPA: hypothetical protein PKA64_01735 [Myxococcota bacterium]|nr:hypothetical protein [Myxococcota bacterium]